MMLLYIAKLVLLLGLAILVHEVGHFLAARLAGIRVLKFSIGFPPRLFGFKRGNTDYVVGATPLGGYVKLAGEEWGEGIRMKKYDLMAKPWYARVFVYAMGVVMNAAMAWAIFFGLMVVGVPSGQFSAKVEVTGGEAQKAGIRSGSTVTVAAGKPVKSWGDVAEAYYRAEKGKTVSLRVRQPEGESGFTLKAGGDIGMEPWVEPVIGATEPFQPARKAGLLPGDRITAVNGNPVERWSQAAKAISATREGRTIRLDIVRGGKAMKFTVLPRYDSTRKRAVVGISAQPAFTTVERFGVGESAVMAGRTIWMYSSEILVSVWRAITRQVRFKDVLGGPVLIARVGYEKAQQGAADLLHFIAVLSISLLVVNMLPIPAVDGGMILLALLEGIRGRKFSMKTYQTLTTAGFALLMLVFLYATYFDLNR